MQVSSNECEFLSGKNYITVKDQAETLYQKAVKHALCELFFPQLCRCKSRDSGVLSEETSSHLIKSSKKREEFDESESRRGSRETCSYICQRCREPCLNKFLHQVSKKNCANWETLMSRLCVRGAGRRKKKRACAQILLIDMRQSAEHDAHSLFSDTFLSYRPESRTVSGGGKR